MKKQISLLAVILIIILVLSSCSKEVEFGWGNLENGHYTNEFFDFSIDISPDFVFLTPQEIVNANPQTDENGEDLPPVDITAITDLGNEPLVQFIYASMYTQEVPGRINPYINVFSESMAYIGAAYSKEEYVKNYMDFSKTLYDNSLIEAETYPLEKLWLGERQFAKGSIKINYDQYTLFQDMYAVTKGNYIFVIMIVYTNEAEKNEFESFVNSIQIK